MPPLYSPGRRADGTAALGRDLQVTGHLDCRLPRWAFPKESATRRFHEPASGSCGLLSVRRRFGRNRPFLTSTTRLCRALHGSACNTRHVIFASSEDWARFRYSVKNRRRYVIGPSLFGGEQCDGLLSHEHFLEWLLNFLKERNRFVKLDKGTVLWRAQLGGTPHKPPPITVGAEEWGMREILTPHDRDRMTPYSDKAKEGRINPKGIPCLYTATHPRVALAEMKPTIGSVRWTPRLRPSVNPLFAVR